MGVLLSSSCTYCEGVENCRKWSLAAAGGMQVEIDGKHVLLRKHEQDLEEGQHLLEQQQGTPCERLQVSRGVRLDFSGAY